MPESILEWGIALILTLQGWGDWLILPMNIFTFTGYIEFYLLLMHALYWCYNNRLGFRIAIILMLSAGLNAILKAALHDPRPYWIDPQVRLLGGAETSFGIPSGHAQNAVVLWGLVAAHFKKRWGWVIAAALIFFIGFSRMFLGVHFPTDVFFGWALGIMILFLVLYVEGPVVAWIKGRPKIQQLSIAFALSVALIVTGALIIANVAGQAPDQWAQNAIAVAPDKPITPLSLKDLIVSSAAFFGLVGGVILLESRGGFNTQGPGIQLLGRYVVGVIGIIILWRGLGALFSLLAHDETLFGYVLDYIRYSLIGAWVSGFGPLVFMRVGLAKARQVT